MNSKGAILITRLAFSQRIVITSTKVLRLAGLAETPLREQDLIPSNDYSHMGLRGACHVHCNCRHELVTNDVTTHTPDRETSR